MCMAVVQNYVTIGVLESLGARTDAWIATNLAIDLSVRRFVGPLLLDSSVVAMVQAAQSRSRHDRTQSVDRTLPAGVPLFRPR
jgi:hypothetical protein